MALPLNGLIAPSGGGSSTANPAGFTNGYPSADNQVLRSDGTSGAIQGSPLTSADWNGDLAGPVTTTQAGSVGAAFTNQPAGDTVTIVSSNAADTTQQATLIYDLAGTVTYENIALNGTTPVTTVATMTHVLGIVLNASCAGTVTFTETSGGLTITTITTGNLSKGVTTFSALSCYNRKVQVAADGATTKVVGLGGFNSSGATLYDLVTLSGTTKVLSNVAFATIVQIYAGDVEVARTPSINSIGYIHVDGGTVVTNTDVPPVSVDNTIARWNGTTGEVLQASDLIVGDSRDFKLPSDGIIHFTDSTTAGSGTVDLRIRRHSTGFIKFDDPSVAASTCGIYARPDGGMQLYPFGTGGTGFVAADTTGAEGGFRITRGGSGDGLEFYAPTSGAVYVRNSAGNTSSDVFCKRVLHLGNGVCLGSLTSANMNVTTDQSITIDASSYIIDRIVVTNASINLTTCAGGIYTASSKGGSTIVAAAQTYAALTASTKWINLTLDTTPTTTVLSGGTLYFSLTTAQGASSTSDIFVFGTRLS